MTRYLCTRFVGTFRVLVVAASAAFIALPAHAAGSTSDDWATFSRFLSILQVVMQTAAKDDGKQSQQAFDEILAGRNAEANELAKELFAEVPDPEREKMISIGRSLLVINQRQAALDARAAGEMRAIQARKDLAGMGLVYHDRVQFLDAVRRGDVIAARLFLVGGGVDPNAKDIWGVSALDLAKRNGNPELIALVETAGAK
ncbi:MAG: hypothetical protein WCE38_09865 [Burkholderiales bacterium]